MKIRGFRYFVAGVTAAAILVSLPAGAFAQSNSLGVNPRRDYTVKSGDKVSDTLFVSNLSKTDDLTVDISVIDFGPKGETGSPALLLDRKEPTRWSLKPYLTVAKNVKIAAGKSQEVPFTIAIPANVGAGSYYGAIKYSSSGGGEGNSNVSLLSSSATLVFVRVPGKANSALLLRDFGAFTPTKDGSSGSFGSFYGGLPPKFLSYRLENKGNVAEQPTGSVELKNIFGRQVKLFEKANPNNGAVLIDQTRRIDLCINESKVKRADAASGREIEEAKCEESKLAPGRYTAKISLVYGDDGTNNGGTSHELGRVASFWYLPLWFVLTVAAIVALLAGGIALLVRKVRRGRRGYAGGRRR